MNKEKLKELFEVVKKKHVPISEAAIIICRTMQKEYALPTSWSGPMNEPIPTVWELLPDSALDYLKEWFINNWYRVYLILEPRTHQVIMEMPGEYAEQYRLWFNSHGEKGHKMMRDISLDNIQKEIPWWNKD